MKVYLGGGLYAEYDGYQIELSTLENMRMYLELQVWNNLVQFVENMKVDTHTVIAKCTDTMSEDGGSCGKRIPCTGTRCLDSTYNDPGCGEPCNFVMHPEQYEVSE